MSKAKSDILKKIDEKIKKRKNKETIDPKDYKAIVFDFFRKYEESNPLGLEDYLSESVKEVLRSNAVNFLTERLWTIDPRCIVKINTTQGGNIQGVTIKWTNNFIKTHNIEPSVYVDVSDILLM